MIFFQLSPIWFSPSNDWRNPINKAV